MKNSKLHSDTVYIPEEDSYLLAKEVKKYAKGDVLDMGTGSGIQGISALENKNTKSVLFSDINPKAIEYVKKDLATKNFRNINVVKFKISDLYSVIKDKDKFDTIIFNPPYLPKDELDNEHLITTGGKYGWELIEKFLKQSKNHLNIDGQILLLFSSLSDKGKIDEILKVQGYDKNLIAKQNLFMEQLYIYLLKINNPKIIKGHRGIVEIKGNTAIKRSLTEHYDANSESKFLKILNKHNIGPKLLKHDKKNNSITVKYIDGERILDYFNNTKTSKEEIIPILEKILIQLFIMDELKINKLELTNPYKHIIIQKNNPIMIDFERCIYTQKPKNVTQFIQFLCSGKLTSVFKQKNITIDNTNLRAIAIAYKKDLNKKYLKEIIKCIS